MMFVWLILNALPRRDSVGTKLRLIETDSLPEITLCSSAVSNILFGCIFSVWKSNLGNGWMCTGFCVGYVV